LLGEREEGKAKNEEEKGERRGEEGIVSSWWPEILLLLS
jgi:hypothetical protein